MFTDPVKNLKALGLRENDIVVDLGAGTGFYSIAAAKIVAKGKVYAVEIEKDFLMTIGEKARDAGIKNIQFLWGDVEKNGGTKIGDNIADVCVASNVFSQLENKEEFAEEAKRILKNGGRLLLVDWADSSALPLKHVIKENKAKDIFEKKGFVLEKKIDAGEHHYGMIFKSN